MLHLVLEMYLVWEEDAQSCLCFRQMSWFSWMQLLLVSCSGGEKLFDVRNLNLLVLLGPLVHPVSLSPSLTPLYSHSLPFILCQLGPLVLREGCQSVVSGLGWWIGQPY